MDFISDTGQHSHEELDIRRGELSVMIQERPDRPAGSTAANYTVAKFQRITHKVGRGVVAGAAFCLEPWLSGRLREQHIVDRVDLIPREIMVAQKSAEIMDMVPSLQLATRNTQEFSGEIAGMPVTVRAAVVPQPVQV